MLPIQSTKLINRPQKYPQNVPFYPNTFYKVLPDTKFLFCSQKSYLLRESCTQGDPPAMLMYGIAMKPLIQKLQTTRIAQE